MKTLDPTPDFLQSLGQAVLDFGFMENVLRRLILIVSRTGKEGEALLPPGNTVSQNLELLQRIVEVRIEERARQDWTALVDDLRSLYEERNRIFHGMMFFDEGSPVIAKTKKGRRGKRDEFSQAPFELTSLSETLVRLAQRRRQIFDFLDDYATSDEGPAHTASQDAFPSLRVTHDA